MLWAAQDTQSPQLRALHLMLLHAHRSFFWWVWRQVAAHPTSQPTLKTPNRMAQQRNPEPSWNPSYTAWESKEPLWSSPGTCQEAALRFVLPLLNLPRAELIRSGVSTRRTIFAFRSSFLSGVERSHEMSLGCLLLPLSLQSAWSLTGQLCLCTQLAHATLHTTLTERTPVKLFLHLAMAEEFS